jgi:hypothetical protein
MVTYRIYRIDKANQLQGPGIVVECEDDDAALIKAQEYVDGLAVEIWDEARKVAFIPSDE